MGWFGFTNNDILHLEKNKKKKKRFRVYQQNDINAYQQKWLYVYQPMIFDFTYEWFFLCLPVKWYTNVISTKAKSEGEMKQNGTYLVAGHLKYFSAPQKMYLEKQSFWCYLQDKKEDHHCCQFFYGWYLSTFMVYSGRLLFFIWDTEFLVVLETWIIALKTWNMGCCSKPRGKLGTQKFCFKFQNCFSSLVVVIAG